jgi:hypothetical protein
LEDLKLNKYSYFTDRDPKVNAIEAEENPIQLIYEVIISKLHNNLKQLMSSEILINSSLARFSTQMKNLEQISIICEERSSSCSF